MAVNKPAASDADFEMSMEEPVKKDLPLPLNRRPLPPAPPLPVDSAQGGKNNSKSPESLHQSFQPLLSLLLPVILWKQKWHPMFLIVFITAIFAFFWILRLSAVSTACFIGALIISGDLLVPIAANSLFSTFKWTEEQENDYAQFCHQLRETKSHLQYFFAGLKRSRKALPQFFTTGMCIILLFAAVLFNSIGDFVIAYVTVMVFVLAPGFCAHNCHTWAYTYARRVFHGAEAKDKNSRYSGGT